MLKIPTYLKYAFLGFKNRLNTSKNKQNCIQYVTKLNTKQNATKFKEVDYGFVVKLFWVY